MGGVTVLDALPDEAFIAAVTLAELSVGRLIAMTHQERVASQAHLRAAEADLDPLPFRCGGSAGLWWGSGVIASCASQAFCW